MSRHFRPLVSARLDLALSAALPDISRRAARRLIAAHAVLVNGRPIGVASRTVTPKDEVLVVDQDATIPILSIGDDFIAVDKPSGLATQPMRERSHLSLSDLLSVQLKKAGLDSDLFVVHRLDYETSGVVLFGRTRPGAARLSGLLTEKTMVKTYLAVVSGAIDGDIAIDSAIGRESASSFTVSETGRPAETRIRSVAVTDDISLVEATIGTGRTHQIRLHLEAIGHPVLGDPRYGVGKAAAASRLLLHSWRIEEPSLGRIEAPVPEEFRSEMGRLGLPQSF